jgi:hypothetical protein
MAMTGGTDSHTCIAVKENVAIDIFNPDAPGAFSDEFERRTRIGRIHKLCIRLDDLLAIRTW